MQIIDFWRPLLFPWRGRACTENRQRHTSNRIKSSNNSINKEVASPKPWTCELNRCLCFSFVICYPFYWTLVENKPTWFTPKLTIAKELPGCPGDTVMQGLDSLAQRCKEYKVQHLRWLLLGIDNLKRKGQRCRN